MSASVTIPATSDAELARVVRESLRLAEGDMVIVERREGEVVLRREDPTPTDPPLGRLVRENGLLVWDSGVDIDSPRIFKENGNWVFSGGEPSDYSIPDLIDEARAERIRELGGE